MQTDGTSVGIVTGSILIAPLSHIVEPSGLLLTWQSSDEQAPVRTRRVVARVHRLGDSAATFEYLTDSEDFRAAKAAGFKGYPAFDLRSSMTSTGVLEAFLRRLPPRRREDFSEFLSLHRLPSPFVYSDFALLGYTGARLPSDGFALVPEFDGTETPCEYILEVAGFHYENGLSTAALSIADPVNFEVESDNLFDPGAVAIVHDGKRIGYVNRALRHTFQRWLETRNVVAAIERINGKPERPLIYVRVKIDC